jgi:tetratricopeptide (TPR) repeat protein
MVEAWRALGKLEEKARNLEGIVSTSRRIAELDPKDIESRLRIAKFGIASGALDDALKTATAAVEIDPKNTSALALRAAALLRLKDNNGAIQEAHKILAIDPANLDAMMILAAEKLVRGDPKAAMEIMEDVPAKHQNDLGLTLLKAKVYERMGDLPKVEAQLRKLIELNPKEMTFKRELLKFLIAHKRVDDAEKEMREIVSADPTQVRAGLDLVRFLHAVRGPAAARAELDARIKAGGTIFPYQIALAELDFVTGKVAESISSLEGLVASSTVPADKLTAQTKLAEIYLSRRNFDAAEPLVNSILEADGRNTTGLKLRATIRMERGQLEEATTDLRQALNDQPRSPDLLMLLATAFERSGSIDLADKQLADALKASNFAPDVGLSYISFLRRRGLGTHADNVLAELATRNPNSIPVLSALAQTKLASQDWAGANEIAETIRKIGNRSGIADQITGAALSGEKKYDESLGVLQNAYEANPDAVQPMLALVRTYIQAKQTDKAEAFLDSVLKVNPQNSEAHILMGMTKMVKNQPNEAISSFKLAIEKQPKSPAGYSALADVYLRQKDADAAIKVIQDGLKQIPEQFQLRLTLAGILEAKGDFDAAIDLYESLIKQQPGSLIVANNLASLLTDHRTDQQSRDRAFAVAGVLAKSQVPQFKDTLGWILHLRGDHRGAVPLLEEAAAALPNLAAVRYHLGVAYAASGQPEKGAQELNKALELAASNNLLKDKIRAAMK